jgi:hypothetical protein
MGLLEALVNEGNFPKTRRSFCSVCNLLGSLDIKEREALEARMSDKQVSHTALSLVLRSNGHDISDGTIGRHRRKVCGGVAKK